jgi:hypothetical protein
MMELLDKLPQVGKWAACRPCNRQDTGPFVRLGEDKLGPLFLCSLCVAEAIRLSEYISLEEHQRFVKATEERQGVWDADRAAVQEQNTELVSLRKRVEQAEGAASAAAQNETNAWAITNALRAKHDPEHIAREWNRAAIRAAANKTSTKEPVT